MKALLLVLILLFTSCQQDDNQNTNVYINKSNRFVITKETNGLTLPITYHILDTLTGKEYMSIHNGVIQLGR